MINGRSGGTSSGDGGCDVNGGDDGTAIKGGYDGEKPADAGMVPRTWYVKGACFAHCAT